MKPSTTPTGLQPLSPQHQSPWIEAGPKTNPYHPLNENLETDVVIIGGGLAGVTTAYCLSQSGKKVVLVEDGIIGSGETSHTTAQLVTALDDRYAHFEKLFGEEDTRLIAQSHKAAIDFVEQTIHQEKIDCLFDRVPGYLFCHPSDREDILKDELSAAQKAGIHPIYLNQIPGMLNDEEACLEFPRQAQFHPLLYLHGLCKVIVEKGGQLFTNTHAAIINADGIISEDGFIVKADHVVVATNSPVNNLVAMHLKQTAFRTYVVAGLVQKNALPRALWWDTGDHDADQDFPPYHYVRLTSYNDEYELLISGGEDHPTGDLGPGETAEENRYQKLEAWTRDRFPLEDILYRWSGQVLEPVDSLAFIGRNTLDKNNVYIITGDSGTGMTHCTIGGMLIRDLIMGIKNPWEEIYRPSRITMNSSLVFFKELIRGIKSVLQGTPDDESVKEVQQIKEGEAKICKIDGHKCGVYHDLDGDLQIVSARCTHLGATLHWNADEKSWDCPWHGSRFTSQGTVLNGPANSNLPFYEVSATASKTD